MSVETKISEIVNATSNEEWARFSEIYLHNASAGKPLEIETLRKIASETIAGCDKDTILEIAKYENRDWSPAAAERRIKLYLLQHRSGYNPGDNLEYLKGSTEESYTSSTSYIDLARECGLTEVSNPSASNQGYQNISSTQTPIYHLVEEKKLFGQEQPYGFAFSISTAASLFNGETGQAQSYSGYFYEGGGSIPDIGGIHSNRILQTFVYTRGGGPVSSNNWIIKVVETSVRNFIGTAAQSKYSFLDNGSPFIVLKTYIHFFKPDGSYVRRAIDRSDTVEQYIAVGDLTTWYYEDFNNLTAKSNNQTFKSVWNSCYSGNYKISGKPTNYDFSLYWNQGKPGGIANGRAIHSSLPNWNGKEVL